MPQGETMNLINMGRRGVLVFAAALFVAVLDLAVAAAVHLPRAGAVAVPRRGGRPVAAAVHGLRVLRG